MLEDIFVAVALLAISVGLVLPGMIAHAAGEIADAAARLSRGMLSELTTALEALGRGDLDAARAVSETTPVVVQSKDELGSMAANFNSMQIKLAGAADALDGAREGLRTTRDRLQRNIAQQAAVAHLGERALEGAGLDELLSDATRTVADVLAVEIAAVFELDPDSGALGLRASVGLPAEATRPTFAKGHSFQAAYTLAVGTPVIVADWSNELRFKPSPMLELVRARSGITVPIDGGTRPHGVLGVQSFDYAHLPPTRSTFCTPWRTCWPTLSLARGRRQRHCTRRCTIRSRVFRTGRCLPTGWEWPWPGTADGQTGCRALP